ncbi:sarcosine oxidase subunit gamma [Stappia taiwanensis]|uniref:Sarcosine oxidase subunit gamma n=1 Tax=Stappia taiwanensis TaxID=992267 RepID=A0A838XJH4_9HYPH|nr:sarcosine oxidase subunit gamma family protein [Stappia taiwanensis]MBA4610262.1 sarcosine oxidase subunit gamma [Stappia taiwanensis]GGE78124.1 sarcosine oxidase subunit gamma [Stappia taiwanensis]
MSEAPLYSAAGDTEAVLAAPGLRVSRTRPLARFAFRGDPAAAGKAGAAFGASLPMTPLAANRVSARAALWLGPDEWLLLAADETAAAIAVGMATALADAPHALVDVSERNVALLVEGEGAERLLNTQVFLDLDPAAFPVGMATRTLFAKAEIILWRLGDEAFAVECWRSFAPYIEGLLVEGARGL